jgi:hypothetical protein
MIARFIRTGQRCRWTRREVVGDWIASRGAPRDEPDR